MDPEEKSLHDRPIVYLLTYAGLRVDELSNLKLTDIDLVLKRLRIIGKGKKVRIIPISNTPLVKIQDWLVFLAEVAKQKPHVNHSLYVFYSQRPSNFTVRRIQPMIKDYSLLNTHMLCYTFCK